MNDITDFNINPIYTSKKVIYELKTDMPKLDRGYPISANIVADSISDTGIRITTLELIFPRYILAEFNTHRVFSRNASSSRAIPTKKLIENTMANFVEPVRYGMNKAGMQASATNLTGKELAEARKIWKHMAETITKSCLRLSELGLHKQWASRPIEWFSATKVVMTSTDFENFFILRDHPDAQDEICYLAQKMKLALNESNPTFKTHHQWHMPYVSDDLVEELGIINALKVSSARCARTSYKTVHGVTSTLDDDITLFKKLTHDLDSDDNPFHASPTEHQAKPALMHEIKSAKTGNFTGWNQHRKLIELKEIFHG